MTESRFAWAPIDEKIEGLRETLRRLGPMPTKRLLKQSGLTRGMIEHFCSAGLPGTDFLGFDRLREEHGIAVHDGGRGYVWMLVDQEPHWEAENERIDRGPMTSDWRYA